MMDESRIRNLRYQISEKMPLSYSDLLLLLDLANAQAAEVERLRVEAQAQFDRGYYDGCANPIVRYDALRDALQHCADAIASWAKKPEGADPWLLGALDNALEALEQNK